MVWVDCIAVNQHGGSQNHSDTTSEAFESVVRACTGGTIVVVDMSESRDSNPAKRGWCIFEWDHTLLIHGHDGLHMVRRIPNLYM